MKFETYLREFVNRDLDYQNPNYKPLLHVIATGGGMSLARLMTVPGSSAYVSGMEFPYDTHTVAELIDSHIGNKESKSYLEKAVQPHVACWLANIASRKSPTGDGIGITSALTTNRYRRGDTHAYVTLASKDYQIERVLHLKFGKVAEHVYSDPIRPWAEQVIHSQRVMEDEIIAKVVLSLVWGYKTEENFWALKDAGIMTEVDFNDS